MGLEQMGYVKMNLEALWVDPADYQQQLCDAVAELEQAHLVVSVYNHQLCTLDRRLWPNAVKSISDWKNEFVEECGSCRAKPICGGFFSSSTTKVSRSIHRIDQDELVGVGLRTIIDSVA